MSSAAERVFNITELLERILLYLPIPDYRINGAYSSGLKTVLMSYRVNKTFQATIDGSTELQHALFFKSCVGSKCYNRNVLLMAASLRTTEGHTITFAPHRRSQNQIVLKITVLGSKIVAKPTGSWRRMHLFCGDVDQEVIIRWARHRDHGKIVWHEWSDYVAGRSLGELFDVVGACEWREDLREDRKKDWW